MSRTPTGVDNRINEYIRNTFSKESKFLANLVEEAEAKGFPQIAIAPEQANFLQFLIKTHKSKRILEIGSLFGYSAICMAQAFDNNGLLTAIEINPDFAEFIRMKAGLAGLTDKIEVMCLSGMDYLSSLDENVKFDFIFLDADKTNYLNYLKLAEPHLKAGGIIAADNALAFGFIAEDEIDESRRKDIEAMREFNKFLSTHPKFFSSFVTMGDGIALAVKIKE